MKRNICVKNSIESQLKSLIRVRVVIIIVIDIIAVVVVVLLDGLHHWNSTADEFVHGSGVGQLVPTYPRRYHSDEHLRVRRSASNGASAWPA